MLLNCGLGEDSWESLGQQGNQSSQSYKKSVLNIHWKDWCWSWNSNTLATRCEELTQWRPWCWERLRAEGGDIGGDGWMASPTRWTWVWANFGIGDDREAWRSTAHGVAKSQTWLSNWTELNWDSVWGNEKVLSWMVVKVYPKCDCTYLVPLNCTFKNV